MIRSGGEVARLIAELQAVDPTRREAAIARLRVAGSRAVDALAALTTSSAPVSVRAGALKALDGSPDPRAVDAALGALAETDPLVVLPAVAVLRQWLAREEGTRVLEALTSLSLDRHRDPAIRLAAMDALGDLPRRVVGPVLEQAAATAHGPQGPPDDPMAVQEELAGNPQLPLSELHALVVRLHEHERQERSPERRHQWARSRATAHAVLARRGSKVALYDLRETFDAAREPLPLDFLTAVIGVGDPTCLEPLARAWAAAPREEWWRSRLADAAADIVRRSRLSGRNAVVKRIRAKWPGFL